MTGGQRAITGGRPWAAAGQDAEDALSVLEALGAVPDLAGALCKGRWADWDLDGRGPLEDPAERERRLVVAARTCRRCPALVSCRDHLEGLTPCRRPLGAVAGVVVRPANNAGSRVTSPFGPGTPERRPGPPLGDECPDRIGGKEGHRHPRLDGPGRCRRCSYHVPSQGHCTVCSGDQWRRHRG